MRETSYTHTAKKQKIKVQNCYNPSKSPLTDAFNVSMCRNCMAIRTTTRQNLFLMMIQGWVESTPKKCICNCSRDILSYPIKRNGAMGFQLSLHHFVEKEHKKKKKLEKIIIKESDGCESRYMCKEMYYFKYFSIVDILIKKRDRNIGWSTAGHIASL